MDIEFSANNYNIYVIKPDGMSFYFPYILGVPKVVGENTTLYLETNNEEDASELNKSSKRTMDNIINMMNGSQNKAPILVPIIPTNGKDSSPYFQQLSFECFDNTLPKEQQRIDLQLLSIIDDAKNKFLQITGQKLEDKIFMHGYSASGVFAQRFALSHPEIIDTLCVGGAIGSIPMPLGEYNGVKLDYPIGVNNYESIFNKSFNLEDYKKIKFRYYVAELEDKRLSVSRITEDGSPAPMHDMSYMDRSIPKVVGQNLRNAFGKSMNERCRNQLAEYRQMGIDISAHEPYKGIMHNEIRNSAFKYIDDCMREMIQDREKC